MATPEFIGKTGSTMGYLDRIKCRVIGHIIVADDATYPTPEEDHKHDFTVQRGDVRFELETEFGERLFAYFRGWSPPVLNEGSSV
jgi:hypothetical protein